MYIEKTTFKTRSGKMYSSTLLRQSYREGGKTKKRTIANLSKCSPDEIRAIKLALKNKKDLIKLDSFDSSVNCSEGLSVGSVCTVFQIAKRLGIVDALGNTRQGELALWQVISRVIDQGSRLSAVRLAQTYAIASVIDLKQGFNEDALYRNLHWLSKNQEEIEQKLFKTKKRNRVNLFLYDVTSTYLEGDNNELADWGYNRDRKRGKKQIVIGLLCDDRGSPISVEVFKGNTQDLKTFASQVTKIKNRFGCKEITFVGDRGMIKRGQIEDLLEHGFHYITAITKKQIEKLIDNEVFQLDLFSKKLFEIDYEGVRYILKRNPVRADEIDQSRQNKKVGVQKLISERNEYLKNHPRAKVETALKIVNAKINKLKVSSWLFVKANVRKLVLECDNQKMLEESALDGCYVIKTDLNKNIANAKTIHDRYKDLALVESAFRTCKSNLEIRPVYVQMAQSTYGHVFVVMLAYMIIRELEKLWANIDIRAEEGLASLSTLTTIEITVKGEGSFQKIPEPREINKELLKAVGVQIPKVLPKSRVKVATKKSLARDI
jgi:transposase